MKGGCSQWWLIFTISRSGKVGWRPEMIDNDLLWKVFAKKVVCCDLHPLLTSQCMLIFLLPPQTCLPLIYFSPFLQKEERGDPSHSLTPIPFSTSHLSILYLHIFFPFPSLPFPISNPLSPAPFWEQRWCSS